MNTATFAPALFELLAKSVLILAAAALIDGARLRASAAQRHLVWCAALCILLILPLTRAFEPRWTVPLQRVTIELAPPTPLIVEPIVSVPAVEPSTVPVVAAPRWRAPDWKAVVLWMWAAGAGLVLAARLLGSLRLVRLRRTMLPLEDERTRRLATEIFREFGIRRHIELRLSPAGCVPLTWGTWRPVLTLPEEALEWSDVALTAALRHEAGHIARYDHLSRWLAQLACVFYWPNPLSWIAARRLRAAQEEAADNLVLRAGTAPEDYAAQLFDVARTLASRHQLAGHALAMASPSTLERRMLAIVDHRRDRRPLTRRAMFVGGLAVVLALVISTAAQLRAQEQKLDAGAAVPAALGQQITIEAKFIELTPAAREKLNAALPGIAITGRMINPGGLTEAQVAAANEALSAPPLAGIWPLVGVLTDSQFDAVKRQLGQEGAISQNTIDQMLFSNTQATLPGVSILATPRVTTRSGQRAVIEIIREFRYPSEYEKEGAGWKPKAFDTRNVGVSFEVEPVAGPDGQTLDLRLVPSVVRFLGWIDPDDGRKYPAPPRAGLAPEKWAATIPEAPANHRLQPVFSTRKTTSTVSVFDGQTAVLASMGPPAENQNFPGAEPERELLVFVTAKRVYPGTAGTPSPVPSEAKHSIPLQVATRLPFLTGDSVEMLELRGSEPVLKVGGTYWLRGRYELGSRGKAQLYLGNTSAAGLAIEPAPGGIHSAFIEKGRGEFAFSFRLLAPGTVHLSLYDPGSKDPKNNAFGGWSLGTVGSGESTPKEISEALRKAGEIIIPKMEFREAKLAEMLDFLRKSSVDFDSETEASKRGVKIILQDPPPEAERALISLNLTSVPLREALRYVASLAGLEVVAEPNALVLRAPGTPPQSAEVTVDLKADYATTHEGIMTGEGNVVMTFGRAVTKADYVSYNIARKVAEFHGRVEVVGSENTVSGDKLKVEIQANGQMKIDGPHKTTATIRDAVWVSGKPGYVVSPYAPASGYIDVTGFPPGTEIKCPYTGRFFKVPQQQPSGAMQNPEKTLGLLAVTAKEQADGSAAKHLTLQIPIKALAGKTVDARELVAHVLFYDLVGEKDVLPTTANVTSHWTRSPADWRDSDTETLEVEYRLPRPDGQDPGLANRKYFGYLVRLYYQDELQAAIAEPKRLAAQFPPPQRLK